LFLFFNWLEKFSENSPKTFPHFSRQVKKLKDERGAALVFGFISSKKGVWEG